MTTQMPALIRCELIDHRLINLLSQAVSEYVSDHSQAAFDAKDAPPPNTRDFPLLPHKRLLV